MQEGSWNELVVIADRFGVTLAEDLTTLCGGDIVKAIHHVGLGLKQAVRGMYQARWFVGYGLCVAERGWEAYQLQIALDRLDDWATLRSVEAQGFVGVDEKGLVAVSDADPFTTQMRKLALVAHQLHAYDWPRLVEEVRAEVTFNGWVRDTVGLDVEYTTYRGWMAAAGRVLFPGTVGHDWMDRHGITARDVVDSVGIDKMLRVLPHLDDESVMESEEIAEAVLGDMPVHKMAQLVKDVKEADDDISGRPEKIEKPEPERPHTQVLYLEERRQVIVKVDGLDNADVVLSFGKPVTALGGEIVRQVLFDLQDRFGMTKLVNGGKNG